MAGLPVWWVPSALWSRDGRAHLRWKLRESTADAADRQNSTFEYVHSVIGRFVYHPNDYLSRHIFLYDNFEWPELRFAAEQARDGGLILDVGANIGLYTVTCARAAGARGRVVAVEPGPQTFAMLTETCRRLALSNVTLLNAAASQENGTALLVSDPHGKDVHQHLDDARVDRDANRIKVETRRLDDICGSDIESVTLLKVDVEGHEVHALRGAGKILANGRVRLIVEFYPVGLTAAGTSSRELWDLLSRTHECVSLYGQDGAALDPALASVTSGGPLEAFNALWRPRPGATGAGGPS